MTQVKDMTDQQLNMALAELMGYTVYHREDLGLDFYRLTDPSGIAVQGFFNGQRDTEEEAWLDIPHFCSDPAASLEVEKVAIEHDFDAYVQNLAIVKWGEPDDDIEDTAVWNKTMRYSIAELLTASPRERAEAAYITLQGALTSSKEE